MKLALRILLPALFCLNAQATETLVTWRNLTLTSDDYQAAVLEIPADKRYEFQTDMQRVTAFLENLLLYRTLAAEARKDGLDKDPLVQREIELAGERVLTNHRLAEIERGIKVPDLTAAAEDQYQTQKAKFKVPEMIEAAHILVEPGKHGGEAAAKARAEEARAKALAGADFAALAKEYSDDQGSAAKGGDLGSFPRGRMLRTFEQAAFALKTPGEISPLVETSYGYHVILLKGRTPEKQLAFADVKEKLLSELRDKYIGQQKAVYLSEIRNDKSIKMNTDAIDKLRLHHPMNEKQK